MNKKQRGKNSSVMRRGVAIPESDVYAAVVEIPRISSDDFLVVDDKYPGVLVKGRIKMLPDSDKYISSFLKACDEIAEQAPPLVNNIRVSEKDKIVENIVREVNSIKSKRGSMEEL